MAYQVLARKYRPLRFSDVVGQDHVTRTLLNALAQDRIAHGYIFSGHRGIGKTTIARILASALNCRNAIGSELRPTPEPCNQCDSCLEIRQGNSVDVIEIDAATNRGIDEIRELRDAARYRPARDRFKIYILDEAHQITDAAFNALLKTLEEPPDHIVFMMATTQPEDIPQTIRSRCQHFSFHAVKLDDIVGQLRQISADEDLKVDDGALALLAEAGDGSMRDALSIMDQAIASAPLVEGRPELAVEQVRSLMGSVSNAVFEQMLEGVHANDAARVLTVLASLLDAGNGASQIARQFVRFLRNTLVARVTGLVPGGDPSGAAAELLQISSEERNRAARVAAWFTEEELTRFLAIMLRTFDDLGYRQEQRFHLELGLLKLVHAQRLVPVERILSQLGGKMPSPSTPKAVAARPAPPGAAAPAAIPAAVRQIHTTGAPLQPAEERRPATVSPFGVSDGSSRPSGRPPGKVASAPIQGGGTEGALALSPEPQEAPQASKSTAKIETCQPQSEADPAADDLQDARRPIPGTQPTARRPPDVGAWKAAVVARLEAAKGQRSAADALDDAEWSSTAGQLIAQTRLSDAMLASLLRKETLELVQTALREAGAENMRFVPLAGAAKPAAAAVTRQKSPRSVAAGSVAELAQQHPRVRQAQELFGGEITNVQDLREN